MDSKEDIIRKTMENYPYPIASSVASAFSISEHTSGEAPYLKFDSLISCIESIIRFIGVIAVQELVRKIECEGSEEPHLPEGIKRWFTGDRRIKKPSYGIWLTLSKNILDYLGRQGWSLVIPEMSGLFSHTFDIEINNEDIELPRQTVTLYDAFNCISKFRNDLSGQHIWDKDKISPDEMMGNVIIISAIIKKILKAIEYFSKITFGFIQEIRLQKNKREDPIFNYTGKKLKGSVFIPQSREHLETMHNFKETGCVIIKYEEEKQYLNLFPFYIYQYENIRCSDIFYFVRSQQNRNIFMGVDKGGLLEIEKKRIKKKLVGLNVMKPGQIFQKSEFEDDEMVIKNIPLVNEELEYIISLIANAK